MEPENNKNTQKDSTGVFSTKFYYAFRNILKPVTHLMRRLGITPNSVTIGSLILAAAASIFVLNNRLVPALIIGIIAALMDIIDGQLAKEFGGTTTFGGILDSTIDRYIDFMWFAAFGMRYLIFGRPWLCLTSFVAAFSIVMISYVKARAESEGIPCKVGKFQRPERLALLGICVLIATFGIEEAIDFMVIFFAVFGQVAALHRLIHVYKQTKKSA
jgi:phosphatidylglycerophosphate synthase